MSITFVHFFFGATPATIHSGTEFLGFLYPSIATFYMATPSETAGAEYLYQIARLYPLQEILPGELVLGGDTAHPVDQCSIIALQAMEIRQGFACMEHVIPDKRIVNSSSGGEGK